MKRKCILCGERFKPGKSYESVCRDCCKILKVKTEGGKLEL